MLNSINQTIYKKCLFPLFFSLFSSACFFIWDIRNNIGYFEMYITLLTLIVFFYALRNIWLLADKNKRVRLYRYIVVFTIVLNSSAYAVSIVFQGMIATIFAVIMLRGFWKIITF